MAEPIQGEGGVMPLTADYLQAVRALCDEERWLLMLDEVQTGNGRTGTYFAYQDMDCLPDVVTTAKGLGNGVPIGACLARGGAAQVLQAGHHGSTYGGNPLVCATALAVIETIMAEDLMANATRMGECISTSLLADPAAASCIVNARGRGLMLGFELSCNADGLVQEALEAGLLINVTAGNTIRLLPPLIINADQAREVAASLAALLRARA